MFEDLLDDEEEVYDIAEPEGLAQPRFSSFFTGHDDVETSIISQINNGSLPHALVLSGPKGIGKATLAYRIARALFKHGVNNPNQDSLFGDAPAGLSSLDVPADDPIFSRVASGGHSDFWVVERPMDERKGIPKDNVNIDAIRKVAPFLRMTSSDGGWRVVIIDDADTMNRNAQNAVLKVLEEPPANTLLILVCHRAGALIPTIRSRCRFMSMSPLSDDIVIDLLKKQYPGELDKDLQIMATMAEGSIGRAIQLMEEGGIDAIDDLMLILSSWENWDWPHIHRFSDKLARNDQSYKAFTRILEWMVSALLFAKAKGEINLDPPLNHKALQQMLGHYSLEEWAQICENLKEHFETFKRANLDNRQAVMGAFSILH